jgi:hypothetical protein
MKTRVDLWSLYEEIIRLRISDEKGYGHCEFCSAYENSTRLHIGVYVRKNFALWFVDENNYICCDQCLWKDELFEPKIAELKKKYRNVKIKYSSADINDTYWKLMRTVKNHLGWIAKIQV